MGRGGPARWWPETELHLWLGQGPSVARRIQRPSDRTCGVGLLGAVHEGPLAENNCERAQSVQALSLAAQLPWFVRRIPRSKDFYLCRPIPPPVRQRQELLPAEREPSNFI